MSLHVSVLASAHASSFPTRLGVPVVVAVIALATVALGHVRVWRYRHRDRRERNALRRATRRRG